MLPSGVTTLEKYLLAYSIALGATQSRMWLFLNHNEKRESF
jgi:hypothetical protein